MGYLPFGQGYVVFAGKSWTLDRSAFAFGKGLSVAAASNSLSDLIRVPAADIVTANMPDGESPILIEPQSNATFPQPGRGEWRFDWEDVPGARSYEIVILGPHANVPMSRVQTKTSEITMGSRDQTAIADPQKAPYIADHNLKGWSWRVRAQMSDGSWGPWSRERRFDVQPREQFSITLCFLGSPGK